MALAVLSASLGAAPARAQAVLETFEGAPAAWQVGSTVAGSGSVLPSAVRAASGALSARTATSSSGSQAAVGVAFSDPAGAHTWQERPGTYRWQRARVFVPSTTLAQLGASGVLTIGRLWASGQNGVGWSLRVRQGGALSVLGTRDSDGAQIEFNVYATLPADQWLELELGLHSQAGPGVKRAFAFVLNGRFHGWYHQGRMQTETYDRAAIGIVDTTATGALEVFIDDFGVAGTSAFPTGTDLRSTAALQTIDYRSGSGAEWQIDWTTWANQLRLDSTHGLYSDTERLQSGRNIDRMPSLVSGWAEIEVGWPKGTPPRVPGATYFGPMVGFRKEINREQNFEVIPVSRGGGQIDLVLEAWDGNGPVILAQWGMPAASVGGTEIPEPGDVIRARWEQVGASTLGVKASYYDASAGTWFSDVIDVQVPIGNINGINFADGFHTASSLTTDSPYYSIRRFAVGTLPTYPGAGGGTPCSYTATPLSASVPAGGGGGAVSVTAGAGCAWTASSNAAWLGVTGGASGSGSGAATWSAAANGGTAARSGTLTVAGQTITITQAGAAVPPPIPSLAIGNAAVVEPLAGTALATFPVTLSAPSAQTVTVQYATQSASAAAGADFVAAAGTLTFPPGATTRVVAVTVNADGADEDVETFRVVLASPSNATIAVSTATGTITPPAVSGPSPPTDLTVIALSGSGAALRWNVPATGPPTSGYRVSGGAAPGDTIATRDVDATERVISLPLPPGIFYVRVQAVSGGAISPPSNEVRVVVATPAAPSAPAGLVALVDGSTVAFAWRNTLDGGPPTQLRLDVSGALAVALPLPVVESVVFGSVAPGTYAVTLRAGNGAGESGPSNAMTVTVPGPCSGAPGTPVNPVVVVSGRTVTFAWDPASSGAAPTSYSVLVSGAFDGAFPVAAHSVAGVVGPGTYALQVAAVNACGQSAPTALQLVMVP